MVVGDEERTATMTPTPIMCQYAEIVFSRAVTLILSRLQAAALTSSTTA